MSAHGLDLAGASGSRVVCPVTVLRNISVGRRMIEDFRPIPDSLGWRLAQAHWMAHGVSSFIDGQVPWVINNDGRLSADAAAVLLANCLESPPGPEGITVLELGAGTGLFARFLLDEFETLCRRGSHSFYERLTYVATDRSPATVEFWRKCGIFAPHGKHVRIVSGDALKPASLSPGPLRAVFCNYLLDTLPSDTFRRTESGWERLHVRAWLNAEEVLPQVCALSVEELCECARAGDLQALMPVLPLLESERQFFPLSADVPSELERAGPFEVGDAVLLNHGALSCLKALLSLLEPAGFVLVNDYGASRIEPSAQVGAVQWFGPAAATGLNFPLLERSCGAAFCTPEGDEDLSLHARLFHRGALPATSREFSDRFSGARRQRFDAVEERARMAAASGDWQEALNSFQAAIDQNPRNWWLIGEAAEFVGMCLRAWQEAADLAQAALDLNQWYSPWLWNLKGRFLACAGRGEDAHRAYLRAEAVNPRDPMTQLHLAESFLERGDPDGSLRAVATGLAHDSRSQFRHALLEKQQAAMNALLVRWNRENEVAARRQAAGLPRPSPPVV